jgi:hypothetical protein
MVGDLTVVITAITLRPSAPLLASCSPVKAVGPTCVLPPGGGATVNYGKEFDRPNGRRITHLTDADT